MRISATEEYGLRILMRIAQAGDDGMSIPHISTAEGLSEPYTGKLTRLLRLSGFVKSTRGKKGGYVLARDPSEIQISNVLQALDGRLFDDAFCKTHTGNERVCTRSVDCSVKSLWRRVQASVDQMLRDVSLQDLIKDMRPFTNGAEKPHTKALSS